MTREELINALQFIVVKCDSIINNDKYTPDDFTNDIVEDIAELCNHILDGDYGKLDEAEQPTLPAGLDEAAENAVITLVPTLGQQYEDGSYVGGIRDYFTREELISLFKAGAKWQAEQPEEWLEEAARLGLDILLEDGAEMFNTEDAARMWDYEGKTEGEIVKAAYIKGGYVGARWQRKQGVTVKGYVMGTTPDFSLGIENSKKLKVFDDGSRQAPVIVQIRKK